MKEMQLVWARMEDGRVHDWGADRLYITAMGATAAAVAAAAAAAASTAVTSTPKEDYEGILQRHSI